LPKKLYEEANRKWPMGNRHASSGYIMPEEV